MFAVALSSSFSDPLTARSCSRPGCGRTATSGGLLDAIREPSTVPIWSPVEVKVAVAPVSSENFFRTASKFFCSSFDQTAATSTFLPASGLLEVVLLPPQAASSNEARTVTENTRPNLELFISFLPTYWITLPERPRTLDHV